MTLRSFSPHADIQKSEVTGQQELRFNINVTQNPAIYEVSGQPYDANRIDRILNLDGVDEWALRSDFVGHPFHIHVNPFQIVRILDPNGKDVSTPETCAPATSANWRVRVAFPHPRS